MFHALIVSKKAALCSSGVPTLPSQSNRSDLRFHELDKKNTHTLCYQCCYCVREDKTVVTDVIAV